MEEFELEPEFELQEFDEQQKKKVLHFINVR
jgi:hypothetical protein